MKVKSKHGPGFVYIMTNPSFKKTWIKIGYTRDEDCTVEQRRKDLSCSSVPFPFELYATLKCPDAYHVEQKIHGLIDKSNKRARLNSAREFYDMEPQDAYGFLCDVAELLKIEGNLRRYKDNKPIQDANERGKEKSVAAGPAKAKFSFDMVGLQKGAQLVFLPTGVKVTAIPPNMVKYGGETYTLTGFTKAFMPEDKRYNSGSYQGPAYFTYKGKKLTVLREEVGK